MIKKTSFILAIVLTLTVSMATLASAGKSLNRILQKGELVVGITGTQPPLNATSKDGKIIGFDADIAKSIALNMGVRLKFFRRPFAELLPALEAGKAVYTDKPIAQTLEDALAIKKVVEKTGGVFAVGHSARRLSGNRVMKQWIDDGTLGGVSMVMGSSTAGASTESATAGVPVDTDSGLVAAHLL